MGTANSKGRADRSKSSATRHTSAAGNRFEGSKRRGLTPLVGRQKELETLFGQFSAAAQCVQVVGIVGDAGIGKSRLVHEFAAARDRHSAILLAHCTSQEQATPFRPFIELVRASFRLSDGDEAMEDRLRQGLARLQLDAGAHLAYLLNLLGRSPPSLAAIDAEIVGLHTRRTLQSLLEAHCRRSPTVLIVEDTHWIDPASKEYLEWAAQAARPLPLLILCTYRPVFRPPWAAAPNFRELHVQPLSPAESLALLRPGSGVAPLPPRFEALVAEKAQGNPLFAEELASHLRSVAASGAQELTLPVTLENLLMERIARLPDESRSLLEASAVIGQRISVEIARRVFGTERALEESLEDLDRRGFLFREGDGTAFSFKHALVRDAVYRIS